MCHFNDTYKDPLTAKGLKLDPKPSDLPVVVKECFTNLWIGDSSVLDRDGTPFHDSNKNPKHVVTVEKGRKFNPAHNKQHFKRYVKLIVMGEKRIDAVVDSMWPSFEEIRKRVKYVGGLQKGKADDRLPSEFKRHTPKTQLHLPSIDPVAPTK
jgi:hypothetical protein